MGRGTYRYRRLDREREERERIPPILRGLGCLIISLFMVLGYWFTGWFLQANAANGWIYLPRGILAPDLPTFLNSFETWFDQGVLVRIVIGILFMLAAYGLMAFIYAIFFPIKPRDIDAPMPRKRRRRKEKRRKA
jgi:hypothetical protein